MGTVAAQPITGPCAWHGRDLARSSDWIQPITAAAVEELDAALRAVKARGLAWRDITRDDFPLAGFRTELAAVRDELEHGRGIVLLRGLPVERYTESELRQLYWGIGAHLGAARYQNAHGELIGEVRDELRAYGSVHQPGVEGKPGDPVTSRYKARSNGPLRFHTDRADVVGLLCVRQARAGGVSKVVSSGTIQRSVATVSCSGSGSRCRTAGRCRPASRCCGAASRRACSAAASLRPEGRRRRHYFTISISSTSKTSVAPGLITGGRPWSP